MGMGGDETYKSFRNGESREGQVSPREVYGGRAVQLVQREERSVNNYIAAIDQGTTSTRFIVFDRAGKVVACAQKEHRQIYPQAGWVEHDAEEIWQRTQQVIAESMEQT